MNQSSSVADVAPRRWTVSSLVLCTGFSLTGAGTIMLGVLLPALSQKWDLRDDKAGFLLFLQFLGSLFGALLTGADRTRALVAGYGLLVVSAGALAFADLHVLFAGFFFFGLGLGLAMTATSLLFSDRYGDDRAVQLERLNFTWSAGAMIAPILLLPFLHGASLRLLFLIFQGLFLLLFLWSLLRERPRAPRSPAPVEQEPHTTAASYELLLPLALLALCAVGVETALSGWLTTYSHRVDPHGLGNGALATSIFMMGIVLSRLVFSTSLLGTIGRRRVLIATLWGTAASVALLISGHSALAIDTFAGLSGFCIGPLYPLVLSFFLERSSRGWIFAVAGIGSTVFPWITGLLSAQFGSLRFGLLAPGAATLFMIVLSAISFRSLSPSRLPTLSSS